MKKLVLILLFFILSALSAFAIVGDDYYLENRESVEVTGRAEHILPNTLRIVLEVGQSETVYATVMPENTRDTSVSWKISGSGSSAVIYPEGKTCRVYGTAPGEEMLEVSTLGGAKNSVAISVREKREIKTRQFEIEEEEKKKSDGMLFSLVQNIIRTLMGFSVMLIGVALILLFKSRGGKAG